MKSRGYLTRSDKILLAVALVVVLPLAVFGMPFFGIGAFILIVGALLYAVLKGVWELGKKRDAPTAPRAIRFSRFMSKPTKIRHHYTVNTSEPSGDDE